MQHRESDQLSLTSTLRSDVRRQWAERGVTDVPDRPWMIVRELANHRFHPVLLLRLSLWAANGPTVPGRLLARVVSFVNMTVYGVEVALQASVGPGLYLPHAGGIVLGSHQIGANATIFQGVTLGATELDLGFDPAKRPHVGDGVVIAAGAKVLGGIRVGDGAVIGANAVVIRDVAPGDVVGGVPARSLHSVHRESDEAAPAAAPIGESP